jgi:hypothetical protein
VNVDVVVYLTFRPDSFLPHPSQFIIHILSFQPIPVAARSKE